jgi:hypothetical protein
VTLTTHAIVGAALASFLTSSPLAAAVAAFASHFALDAIPHWDYPIRSAAVQPNNTSAMRYDRALTRDVAVIGLDALLGTVIGLALFASPSTFWIVLLGAAMAILPDPLQFLYGRFPGEPLRSLQRFHVWIHTKQRLEGRPVFGLTTQLAFVLLFVAFSLALHRMYPSAG